MSSQYTELFENLYANAQKQRGGHPQTFVSLEETDQQILLTISYGNKGESIVTLRFELYPTMTPEQNRQFKMGWRVSSACLSTGEDLALAGKASKMLDTLTKFTTKAGF